MQFAQDLLNYAALVPIVAALSLFGLHLANRFSRPFPQPATTEPTYSQEQVVSAIAALDALPEKAPTLEPVDDLLAIAPTAPTVAPMLSTLPALAKLYGVPGSGKWSLTRKLRANELAQVMSEIAA